MPRHSPITPLLCLAALIATLCASPTLAQQQQTAAARTIALTFEDLPMPVVGDDHIAGPLAEPQYINRSMLGVLRAHHAVALGLVNEAKLNVPNERDSRANLLEDWLTAGMQLGNHGYSHREFKDLTLEQYEAEFLRGDVITVPLLEAHHQADRFFRAPYLDTGDTVAKKGGFDRFLTDHGYRVAPFTIQNQDWMFNASYDEARRHRNTAELARVRAAYLAHVTAEFDYAEQLTEASFGHSIPQIMFMHTDILNADTLDAVLTLMEQRGYTFVPIDTVLQDPAYRTPEAFVGPSGLSWLDRWQPALGHRVHSTEPEPPRWVQENYKRITTEPAKPLHR